MDGDRAMARRIALKVAEMGGRVYYVGGLVRDEALGLESKDVDIEVHGITPRQLEEVLDSVGTRLSMGASFGILSLRGCRLDISMPRKSPEEDNGDFASGADPFIGVTEAARRRDFTMNAMMRDVLTGELTDPFGGLEDLKKGLIRHVDSRTFARDRLRVLRAAQFAARFSFAVAPQTRALCASLDIGDLPFERVGEEVRKALLRAPRPSVFFREVRAMGRMSPWFKELDGPSGEESLAYADAAATLRGGAEQEEDLMFFSIVSFLPEKSVEALLSRLTHSVRTLKYALDMRRLAGPLDVLVRRNASRDEFALLLDTSLCPGDLTLAEKARLLALGGDREASALAETRLNEYRGLISRPGVTGDDLRARGIAPGPQMGRALKYARRLTLTGVPKEQALEETLRWSESTSKE
ncbi:MAG: CCA tRNA nucleotidyltransferase [Clostridia bacterium]|nr:CCA tRNA nucleotidyltransferase [Clostridia bacterium]